MLSNLDLFKNIKFIKNLETELNNFGLSVINEQNEFEYISFSNKYFTSQHTAFNEYLILSTNSTLTVECDSSIFNLGGICMFILRLEGERFVLYSNYLFDDCRCYINGTKCCYNNFLSNCEINKCNRYKHCINVHQQLYSDNYVTKVQDMFGLLSEQMYSAQIKSESLKRYFFSNKLQYVI